MSLPSPTARSASAAVVSAKADAKAARARAADRKYDLCESARKFGAGASFLANVILCHHKQPVRKLAGLVRLLEAGRIVRTADFDMDILVIDGQRAEWSSLETAK